MAAVLRGALLAAAVGLLLAPPGARGLRMAAREHKHTLVFVRHGQSTWNRASRFIGWTDTHLTDDGLLEAQIAGKVLRKEGIRLDDVYTSHLKRAIKTAWLVLDELDQHYVPVNCDWRLNERCYGALVSRFKKECVKEFGKDQVKQWRRSFDNRPPPVDESSLFFAGNNPRYDFIPRELLPRAESLKDVGERSLPCWEERIKPAIASGKTVMVVGHENNMRSIIKHLDGVSDEAVIDLELPRAVPLIYHLDADLKPIPLPDAAPLLSGRYLGDPEEVAAIMERDLKQVYDLSVTENLEEANSVRYGSSALKIEERCGGGSCDVTDLLDMEPDEVEAHRRRLAKAATVCAYGELYSGDRARFPYLAYTNGVAVRKQGDWDSYTAEDLKPFQEWTPADERVMEQESSTEPPAIPPRTPVRAQA